MVADRTVCWDGPRHSGLDLTRVVPCQSHNKRTLRTVCRAAWSCGAGWWVGGLSVVPWDNMLFNGGPGPAAAVGAENEAEDLTEELGSQSGRLMHAINGVGLDGCCGGRDAPRGNAI